MKVQKVGDVVWQPTGSEHFTGDEELSAEGRDRPARR